MTLPTFLIIGAGKAGTSSLYQYLREHPQVYMSAIKETNFFAYDDEAPGLLAWGSRPPREFPVRDLAAYRALFAGVEDEIAVGEASPVYLESAFAPQRIRATLPDARLVVTLRDPASRAYSGYWMNVRQGWESRDLALALDEREDLVQAGFYHALLQRYYELFEPSRINVILFDDLKARPAETMAEIFRFLGVDPTFRPDVSLRHNPGGVARSRLLDALVRGGSVTRRLKPFTPEIVLRLAARIRQRNSRPAPPMPQEMRHHLRRLYQDDVRQLERLLGRDLSHWLPVSSDPR